MHEFEFDGTAVHCYNEQFLMLAAGGGSIDKGQIGTIIYSAKFPLKHHLLFRSHTIFKKSNNRQFKTIIFRLKK